jgi:hypothetical protein
MDYKGEKKVDGKDRRRFLEQMLLGTLSLNAGIVSGMGLIGKGVETVRISAEETKADLGYIKASEQIFQSLG